MLHVVGGTYLETCLSPEWSELFGSGLRGAIIASNLGADVEFSTYVDDFQDATLVAKVAGKFTILRSPTSPTIEFSYVHSLSAPEIIPPPHGVQRPDPITVTGENILRFGMLEQEAVVRGERVVYDPQSPHRPATFAGNSSKAERLAIVLNRSEARILTGETDVRRMATEVLQQQSCAVVVIKCGSDGCCVYDGTTITIVPAYRTAKVWLIGSGDVFAATFAKLWACDRADPVTAATSASKAAAWYSNTMGLQLPTSFPDSIPFPPIKLSRKRRRVYLAGPFFTLAQNWLIEQALQALKDQGLVVFSPLHDVGRGSAKQIYGGDVQGLKECDIVFACVDGMDPGTIYEIGYAHSLQKPVIAFVENEPHERLKMIEGGGCIIERDFATAVYKTNWLVSA